MGQDVFSEDAVLRRKEALLAQACSLCVRVDYDGS